MEDKYYELKEVIDDLDMAFNDCNDKYYARLIQDIIDEIQKEVDELEEQLEKENEKQNKQQNSDYWNSQF